MGYYSDIMIQAYKSKFYGADGAYNIEINSTILFTPTIESNVKSIAES
jgi:hypothetical protein